MKTGFTGSSPRWNRRRKVIIVLSGLLLLALILGTWSGFQLGSFFDLELTNEAPPLDSFSPPSVALGVLNREAQRLLRDYTQKRDETAGSVQLGRDHAGFADGSGGSGHCPLALTNSLARHPFIVPIERLHAQVEELKVDLDCRLLLVYSENGRCHEFVTCYLRLVEERPGTVDILQWLPQAVKCAQSCGRTEELTDALRHFIRFHGTLRRIAAVSNCVEQNLLRQSPQTGQTKP